MVMDHKSDIIGDKDTFMNHYEVWNPPPIKGYWQIGPGVQGGWSTRFAQYSRPTDEQIKNTEQLLGWVWIEPEQNVTESETK